MRTEFLFFSALATRDRLPAAPASPKRRRASELRLAPNIHCRCLRQASRLAGIGTISTTQRAVNFLTASTRSLTSLDRPTTCLRSRVCLAIAACRLRRSQSEPPMSNAIYFTKLIIENIRSFADRQELDLTNGAGRPAPWTLIVGDNGVGKTNLLQCIARMRPVFNYDPDNKKGPLPNPVEPEFAREPKNEVLNRLARHGTDSPARLEAHLSLCKSFDEHQVDSKHISTRHEIKRINGQITDVISGGKPNQYSDIEEPLVLAYGAGRHPKATNINIAPETDPTVSLFKVESSLCDAEDFLYRLDHASMKGDHKATKNLDEIKTMLSKIIEDISDPQSIEIFAPPGPGVSPEKAGIRVDTPYGNVSFHQLSLGYRTGADLEL